MALSLFCDALPYSEMADKYTTWLPNMQLSPLIPNIAYSSSLHWQLYCNKYPDERGVLVDWVKEPETNKLINLISSVLSPLDYCGPLGWLSRKFLDRIVFRKNAFANIPYKLRRHFSQKGKYLFWDISTYAQESIFNDYIVVSQDEGHLTFEQTIVKLREAIETGNSNIFCVLGFADSMGHTCKRGDLYSQRLKKYMDVLKESISQYINKHPNEPVLIVSDHGMSTVKNRVNPELEKRFGKSSVSTYIAYADSAIMCVWCKEQQLLDNIREYLDTLNYGHLLTEDERKYYCATDRKFGDLIFNLREGYVFAENWFGKGIKGPSPDGSGMHGFWPEVSAKDQIASVILINSELKLASSYDYKGAYEVINKIMSV